MNSSIGKPNHRVLILFSGGDASGMNFLLRSAVRVGLNRNNAVVLGVKDGYQGLVRTCERIQSGRMSLNEFETEIDRLPGSPGIRRPTLDLVAMDHASVQGLSSCGGIVLGAARCRKFHDPLIRKQVIDLLDDLCITAAIVVGGDGSAAGAECLANESNLRLILIPATIDNDLPCTESALGFDTAVNNAVWAVEHCNDTANSHHRIIVVEVMGRDSGQLAEATGLAAGAEIAVVPERGVMDEAKMQGIAQRLENSMRRGRRHAICIVAEGVETTPPSIRGPAAALGAYLERNFIGDCESLADLEEKQSIHADVRVTVLGYFQRGGRPSAFDRILAARFANAAWKCIASPCHCSGTLGLQRGRIWMQPFDSPTASTASGVDNDVEPSLDLYGIGKAISAW